MFARSTFIYTQRKTRAVYLEFIERNVCSISSPLRYEHMNRVT